MKPSVFIFAFFFSFSLTATVFAADEWFDWNWHYRFKAEINASNFERYDWIVEGHRDKNIRFQHVIA